MPWSAVARACCVGLVALYRWFRDSSVYRSQVVDTVLTLVEAVTVGAPLTTTLSGFDRVTPRSVADISPVRPVAARPS